MTRPSPAPERRRVAGPWVVLAVFAVFAALGYAIYLAVR